MKKASIICVCVCTTLLLCCVPAFSQGRFDIALEGPWIFYQESKFQLSGDSTIYHALIAIAPKVPGHFPMVFTSGDGGRIDTAGIYCVGLNGVCTLNSINKLGKDTYPDPMPVVANKGSNWHWEKQPGYVVILPMPDSWSADGQETFSFQDSFPSATVSPHTTPAELHAIGIQLHYANSKAKSFSLIGCTVQGTSPLIGTCKGTPTTTANSGTLRMSIRSNENPTSLFKCDYHVHRAYHYMTKITGNADHAFVNVPDYDDPCTPCDPQQDFISSDCATMEEMVEAPTTADIRDTLGVLIEQLKQAKDPKFPPKQFENAESNIGQFITESQLLSLQGLLTGSQLLESQIKGLNIVEAAEREARILERLLLLSAHASTSGKDCRAPAVLVQ